MTSDAVGALPHEVHKAGRLVSTLLESASEGGLC